MTDRLTPERFVALADAYGGVIARWPESMRAEAMRLAADPAMRAVLARAGRLDALLDDWAIAPAGHALAARVMRGAPCASTRSWHRLRLWWSGLGLAAALAGAVTGTAITAAFAPADYAAESGTAFGDLSQGG